MNQVKQFVTMKAKFSHHVICPWFKNRKKDIIEKYSNGKTLYVAKKDGTGRIYYPNGKLAMKIEKRGHQKSLTKIWIFNSGEIERTGVRHPQNFCALFDSLGNGLVYDHCMNKKIVFNQTEGISYVLSGLPFRWKWHDLKIKVYTDKKKEIYMGRKTKIKDDSIEKAVVTKKV